MKRSAIVTSAFTAVVVLVACGGTASEGTKAGSDARPVTLRLATADPPGRPASDDVEEFVRQVHELSGGSIRVEILWEAHERVVAEDDPHPYDALADMVQTGEAELGLVPDSAWIDRGMSSLRALKAPFLITSDVLAEAVVTSELADVMLAELGQVGVVGLALLPETLRHPVGFDQPFLALDDFDGAAMRTLDSATADVLGVLGAEGIALNGNDFGRAVAAGDVVGAESAFAQHVTLPTPGTFTGNITFFPKTNVLVAAAAAVEELDDEQRAILTEAAARTLAHVLETKPTDPESAREYCDLGGSITLATDDAVAAIEEATRLVYRELERDDATSAVIEKVRNLEKQLSAAPPAVAACNSGSDVDAGDKHTADDSDEPIFPDGIYRMEMPAEFLMSAGIDKGTANDHAGIWTLHFEDGQFLDPGCPGSTYLVADRRVSVILGPRGPSCGTAAGAELFSAAWTLEGDLLRFTDVRSGVDGPAWQVFHETLWGGKPWTKIG